MLTPPPRRPRPSARTTLFPDAAAMGDAPTRARARAHAQPTRRALSLFPYTALFLYPDGTAGAESPLNDATWATMEERAQARLVELRRDVEFIEQWLAAAKRERVELRV